MGTASLLLRLAAGTVAAVATAGGAPAEEGSSPSEAFDIDPSSP